MPAKTIRRATPKKPSRRSKSTLTRSYNDRRVIGAFHKLPFGVLMAIAIIFAGLLGYAYVKDIGNSSAAVIFSTGFENGSMSEWGGGQCMRTYSCTVSTNAPRSGNYTSRYELRDGDCPITGDRCYGERAERQGGTIGSNFSSGEGQNRWYSWSMKLENGFPNSTRWQVISQWHSSSNGSPAVAYYISGRSMYMQHYSPSVGYRQHWYSTPLVTGQWIDLKMNIYWTSSSSGYVRLWINGQEQNRYNGSTLRAGEGTYFKQGYYRDEAVSGTGIVYYDNLKVATSEADLGGATPTPTPAPNAPVVNLSASTSSVQVGGAATLSWNVTNNPSSCNASGDWSGAKTATGSQSTGSLSSVRTYSYTLSCTNTGGSNSKTVTISATSTPAPTPTPTPTPSPTTGILAPNNWAAWKNNNAYGTTVYATRSQSGRLLVQYDAYKRGYFPTQWANYCLTIPTDVAVPKSITFNATMNSNNYNLLYAYVGNNSSNKAWAVGTTYNIDTTRNVTINLNGNRNICIGNEVKSTFPRGEVYGKNRFVRVNSYYFNQ